MFKLLERSWAVGTCQLVVPMSAEPEFEHVEQPFIDQLVPGRPDRIDSTDEPRAHSRSPSKLESNFAMPKKPVLRDLQNIDRATAQHAASWLLTWRRGMSEECQRPTEAAERVGCFPRSR